MDVKKRRTPEDSGKRQQIVARTSDILFKQALGDMFAKTIWQAETINDLRAYIKDLEAIIDALTAPSVEDAVVEQPPIPYDEPSR